MNNFYDILKALGQIVFPAILTFVGVCGNSLGWEATDLVIKIGTAFITMWNTIIVVWSAEWKKQQNKELDNAEFKNYEA